MGTGGAILQDVANALAAVVRSQLLPHPSNVSLNEPRKNSSLFFFFEDLACYEEQ